MIRKIAGHYQFEVFYHHREVVDVIFFVALGDGNSIVGFRRSEMSASLKLFRTLFGSFECIFRPFSPTRTSESRERGQERGVGGVRFC